MLFDVLLEFSNSIYLFLHIFLTHLFATINSYHRLSVQNKRTICGKVTPESKYTFLEKRVRETFSFLILRIFNPNLIAKEHYVEYHAQNTSDSLTEISIPSKFISIYNELYCYADLYSH